MIYPKFGATFFDLGLQLPHQILKKSKKFQNPKFFGGEFFFDKRLRIFHKNFWILKFFGLRQILTRQLSAQIKKCCSKFWIFHTFKNFLNCGTNSIFKKLGADNILIFFLISHSTHFCRENFGFFGIFFRQNLYW